MTVVNTKELKALLDRAAKGRAPGDDEIADLLKGCVQSSNEFHIKARDLARAARAIASHARGGNRRMVDELTESTIMEYSPLPDVSGISRVGGSVFVNGKRVGATDRRHVEPLRQALRAAAGAGQPLTRRDVERLATNLDGQAFDTFMAEVIEASREIARIQRTGEQAEARRMADQVARELGQHMVPVSQHPDTDDLTDPRELAALIQRRP